MEGPNTAAITPEGQAEAKRPSFDLQAVMASPAFRPGVAIFAALCLAFWSIIGFLPTLWSKDEYYSHGFLIPFIGAFVIYRWWPSLSKIQPKPSWLAAPFLLPALYVGWVSARNDILTTGSVAFLWAIWFGVAFVAGWVWMYRMTLPVLFIAFALPLWQPIIDNYTNPLQVASAKVSFQMLKAMGFTPFQESSTLVHLPNFTLDVGVPCSGLKLIIALCAFTLFFMMIGGLKWWGNAIMLAIVIPFAIFINGLRIALIGVVGNTWGPDAGHQFHDYSGYITLIVCFLILFRIARLLGWKD